MNPVTPNLDQSLEKNLLALSSYLNAVPLGKARPSITGKVWVELVGVLDIDGLPFEILMSEEDYNNIKQVNKK